MKKSLITNTHGFTSEALRKEERVIFDAFFRQRVTAVRLILEGFSTVKAAEVLGICRQSVSTYVKMFNRGGIAELLRFKNGSKNGFLLRCHVPVSRICFIA